MSVSEAVPTGKGRRQLLLSTLWESRHGLLAAAVLSLLTGSVLAVLAAIGPSLVAARLAPMEAMRVE